MKYKQIMGIMWKIEEIEDQFSDFSTESLKAISFSIDASEKLEDMKSSVTTGDLCRETAAKFQDGVEERLATYFFELKKQRGKILNVLNDLKCDIFEGPSEE